MSINKTIETTLKTGDELFNLSGKELDFKLIDFWKWNVSDLVSNATRGRLAEFIVAKALGVNTSIPRDEWQAYDLITDDGIKIEVKSAAFIQSWYQKDLSKISFSIKKSRLWNPDTNRFAGESARWSDVYVFALLNHSDKYTINPLNLDQGLFYIVSADVITNYKRSEHSITLKSLEKITKPVKNNEIKNAVHSVINRK